jgi:ankyrin repeat protein
LDFRPERVSVNKSGSTALDMAKKKQHAEVVAILRAAGARE